MNKRFAQIFGCRRGLLLGVLLFVCFLIATTDSLAASVQDDLSRLELVVTQTISRLESGIELEQQVNPSFPDNIVMQFELSAIATNHPVVLEEDYYNLGLSLIARHFAKPELAKDFLQKELETQTHRAVKSWLHKEITKLELLIKRQSDASEAKPHEPVHNYKDIIKDLQRTLARAGIH